MSSVNGEGSIDEPPKKKRRQRAKVSCIAAVAPHLPRVPFASDSNGGNSMSEEENKVSLGPLCNQEDPCDQCTKRNMGDECTWDPPPLAGPVPNDIGEEFGSLRRRLVQLEKRVDQLQQKQQEQETAVGLTTLHNHHQQPSQTTIPTSSMMSTTRPRAFSSSFSPASATGAAMLHSGPSPSTASTGLPLPAPSHSGTIDPQATSKPSSSSTLVVKQDVDHTRAETEHAAQALEDLALPVGSRREPQSESNTTSLDEQGSGQPTSTATKTIIKPKEVKAVVESPSGPPPGALTTILLGPEQKTPLDLIKSLPPIDVLDNLVEWYFNSDLCWIYQCLHRHTFLDELKELQGLRSKKHRDQVRVDPAFLSILYMVLCWTGSVIGPVAARKARQHFSFEQLRQMPEVWLDKFEDCLKVAGWSERPQVRIAQALCLRLAWSRTPRQSERDFLLR
ncbi:hypothetical protein OIO90_003937 [Microbotryomycetes sp. JL221]|nr:hypothetical protein OIO90_003937 [Microbotryomycetes sp. JL221]